MLTSRLYPEFRRQYFLTAFLFHTNKSQKDLPTYFYLSNSLRIADKSALVCLPYTFLPTEPQPYDKSFLIRVTSY